MMKYAAFVFVIATAFSLLSWEAERYGYQPPLNKTNAPGEDNCTSCHSGVLNSGPGEISLSFLNGGDEVYWDDTAIHIQLQVSDLTKSRFGFEMTALDSAGNPAGDFEVFDSFASFVRTDTLFGRRYVSHYVGTETNTWDIYWLPPDSFVGPVTFYYAGVAANYNLNTTGDNVYATTTTFAEGLSSVEIAPVFQQVQTFPNPSDGIFWLKHLPTHFGEIQVIVSDYLGKRMATEKIPAGSHEWNLDMNSLPAGTYFIEVNPKQRGISGIVKKVVLIR